MAHNFHPSLIGPEAWEGYVFSDMQIRIKESTDVYGAVLWPSVSLQNLSLLYSTTYLLCFKPLPTKV